MSADGCRHCRPCNWSGISPRPMHIGTFGRMTLWDYSPPWLAYNPCSPEIKRCFEKSAQ